MLVQVLKLYRAQSIQEDRVVEEWVQPLDRPEAAGKRFGKGGLFVLKMGRDREGGVSGVQSRNPDILGEASRVDIRRLEGAAHGEVAVPTVVAGGGGGGGGGHHPPPGPPVPPPPPPA